MRSCESSTRYSCRPNTVATTVNWKPGDDVIIAGSVSNDEAEQLFGDWKEPKPHILIVPQPSWAHSSYDHCAADEVA